MTEQSQAGEGKQHNPEHAGKLHVEIASTIDRFISQYPDTLKSEVLAALQSVRVACENDVYFKRLE